MSHPDILCQNQYMEFRNAQHLFIMTISSPPQTLTPAGTNQQRLRERCGMTAASATAVKTSAGAHSFLTSNCTGGVSSRTMTSSSPLNLMVRIRNISSSPRLYRLFLHQIVCQKKANFLHKKKGQFKCSWV